MATIRLISTSGFQPNAFTGNDATGPAVARLLSWENLIYLADFLWASGRRQLAFAGGEPTDHPQCLDFILYLLDRGFDVTVSTSGFVNPDRLEEFRRYLTAVPVGRLTVVCQLQAPAPYLALTPDTSSLEDFLALMGPWTRMGLTIERLDFSLDLLFGLINRFGLPPHLHLSLANAGPGGPGGVLSARKMREVVVRLYAQRQLFEAHRVRPQLDCGWPLCQFTDKELGWLYRFGGPAAFGCWPALHLSPDLEVAYCPALASYPGKSLFEFDSLEQLELYFAAQRAALEAENAEPCAACRGCQSREVGGCRGWGLCRLTGRGSDPGGSGIAEDED